MKTYLADPKFWISVLAVLVSGWSAANSWRSRKIAGRALAISEGQEERRRPKLGIYLATGFRRSQSEDQLFGFFVSVSNPTDIDNSIAQAELQLIYELNDEITGVCRVSHDPELGESLSEGREAANIFRLPARVDSHQTVSGWLLFGVGKNLLAGRTIDSHKIILEDSHGVLTQSEPILVADWTNEAQ